MKLPAVNRLLQHAVSSGLALAFVFCMRPGLHAETITFEGYVPIPDLIHKQYCSKGVMVLATGGRINGARIFEPSVPTASPTHALTTNFGEELDEVLDLAIAFTTGQSSVSVKVGLDRSYPLFTHGVVAVMYAYSSDTPGTGWYSSRDGLLGWGYQIGLAALSAGIHEITLAGADRAGQAGSDQILVLVRERINTQPVASPGTDTWVYAGRFLALDGTGSRDEDGDPLTFHWSVAAMPAGSSPELAGQNTATPTFRADLAGRYEVELVVSDGKVGSVPERVRIDVVPNEPVASAGPDRTVERTSGAGAPVALDGSGSYSPDGKPLTYVWTWAGGTATGVNPTVILPMGVTAVTLTVSDGERSATDTVVITVVDTTPPQVTILTPHPNAAVQDGVTFQAQATDVSGIEQVSFRVREFDGGEGVPVGWENLAAHVNDSSGLWESVFDTTALPDGHYVILARAVDTFANEGWSQVRVFSIRNWALIELLPATPNSKAGRTMPVKFSLRVAGSVDPAMPFVYNDDLEIRIYSCNPPGCVSRTLKQTSLFGSGSRDYRIDVAEELYITNFQTDKTAAPYLVEVWRRGKGFLVGSFPFSTVK